MNDIAIRVEHLGKCYHISQRAAYETFQEAIINAASAPLRRLKQGFNSNNGDSQSFWALKDVSFDVESGDVLGIIGRNGSGKSTLLKILSRITVPTEGHAEIHGRAGSLLEVGTGFHPELTGRENIYLSGSILGMKKREIEDKFDEIIKFSEIEKFLDTPVKHYSSGMHVRLAFAVAAHLDPEILLIDEVLAVGDAAFQKKCLGKMGNVAREGRTVLFVSHNMPAVQRLCGRAHLLEQGRIVSSGEATEVIDDYYELATDRDNGPVEIRDVPAGAIRFVDWYVEGGAGDRYSCQTGEQCKIQFKLIARRSVQEANFGIALWSEDGILIWAMRSIDHGAECLRLKEGIYTLQFFMPWLPLKPGGYQILVSANDLKEGVLDSWYARPKLQILPKNESGLPLKWQGILNLNGEFTLLDYH